MKKNRVKDKDYSLIEALISMCLLVLGHMFAMPPLVWIAIGFYLFIVIFAKEENIFPLLLFFLPWSAIIKLSPNSISFASIATILLFFVLLFKKQSLKGSILLSASAIIFTTLLSKAIQNYSITTSYIMNIFMLIAFPMILHWTKEKISFEKCVMYFSIGIISGSVLSFMVLDNPNIAQYVGSFSELTVERYCGFYSDPNYFSAHIITAVGGLLLLIVKSSKREIVKYILVFCLVAFGLTSVSKSFILGLLLVLAIWIFILLFKRPSKLMITLFICFVIVVIAFSTGIFSGIINNYLFRFGLADDISGLTTGRSDIWKDYIEFLINNPIRLLIGQGYTDDSYSILGIASHNIFIQLIYQLGLIGFAFFIIWIWISYPWKGISTFSILHFLMWMVACFIMWMGLDMMFLDDMFLIFMTFHIGFRYLVSAEEMLSERKKSIKKIHITKKRKLL